MAKLEIDTAEYWHSPEIDIRLNPALKINPDGLVDAIRDRGFTSAVVLATSGSAGEPKYIVLEKSAILHSAEAVNKHCSIKSTDSWLGGLSTFHIGGLAIYARAVLTGSAVIPMDWNRWTRDGSAFVESVKHATITSLTPIHLYDLVNHKVQCPTSLRGVFIGGGKLEPCIAEQAIELGYPIWTTFGMTETASQIATSLDGNLQSLPILPHWQAQVNESGQLKVKGKALMTGYFTKTNNRWQWHQATDKDGYFETGDLVSIENNQLTPLGRADHQIKILGELVSISELESIFRKQTGRNCIVWAEPEARRGFDLFACIESEISEQNLDQLNANLPPFKFLKQVHTLATFPRTEVGKIDRKKITTIFKD